MDWNKEKLVKMNTGRNAIFFQSDASNAQNRQLVRALLVVIIPMQLLDMEWNCRFEIAVAQRFLLLLLGLPDSITAYVLN